MGRGCLVLTPGLRGPEQTDPLFPGHAAGRCMVESTWYPTVLHPFRPDGPVNRTSSLHDEAVNGRRHLVRILERIDEAPIWTRRANNGAVTTGGYAVEKAT